MSMRIPHRNRDGGPVDTRADDHVDHVRHAGVSGLRGDTRVRGRERARGKQARELGSDERGAVYVEYLVVASMVTITGAAAVVTLGVPLYNLFRYVEMMILLPVP
ncbi:MAG: hypothetical protein H6721_13920 [Sandaracinus sp.]|nr:hypothetical protein [Sandaracinus sp.]